MYELKPIPTGHPEEQSTTGKPYTFAIYHGNRWIYRFRRNGLRRTTTGYSLAEHTLHRLNNPDTT